LMLLPETHQRKSTKKKRPRRRCFPEGKANKPNNEAPSYAVCCSHHHRAHRADTAYTAHTAHTIERGSPTLFWQRATIVIVGWFEGRTCKNHSSWYTWPPKLLCSIYSKYVIHRCGRWPHNTTWWDKVWTPRHRIFLETEPNVVW
jgi:hypothetical protein